MTSGKESTGETMKKPVFKHSVDWHRVDPSSISFWDELAPVVGAENSDRWLIGLRMIRGNASMFAVDSGYDIRDLRAVLEY